jgi:hypothetical protein
MMGLLAAGAMFVTGCANETPIVDVAGTCGIAFQGEPCTWARAQGETVVEAGVTIPLASIQNAPMDQPMAWPPRPAAVLPLPERAVAMAGLTQMTFYWEPVGHPPAAYMTPHFDFHFYLVPDAERLAIDCTDTTKPAEIPAGYILPDEKLPEAEAKMMGIDALIGVCIPQMGMHALVQSEYESGQPFRGNFVIGYYHAKPIFIEPMISRAMLLEKKSFELPIPAIPGLTGAHPTVFRADYDATSDSYRFVFSGFTTAP